MISLKQKKLDEKLSVLIIGGYGTFGTRLVNLLSDEAHLKILVAGRAYNKARQVCESFAQSRAELLPCLFDRDKDVVSQLKGFLPDIVVDASGPFQIYRNKSYAIPNACIELGIDYIDLADGSDFVCGIEKLDEAARKNKVFILSGASTCPALTCAVIRELARSFKNLESVAAGIAPSPHVKVGPNVLKAILSYAGKPMEILRKGQWVKSYALMNSRNYQIFVPGHEPLQKRRFSLVDVPDIKMIARQWPEVQNIWFGAGPSPKLYHKFLNKLSWLVRLKMLSSLKAWVRPAHWVMSHLTYGENRGGMYVFVQGRDEEGQLRDARWHVIAEKDHGPFIPAMASAILIKKCLAGKRPKNGARPAHQELALLDFENIFKTKEIFSTVLDGNETTSPALFPKVLQQAYKRLAKPVRKLHDFEHVQIAEGVATVTRGRNPLSWGVARMFGFPPAGENVPVKMRMTSDGKREIWERWFGDDYFKSYFMRGKRRYQGLAVERFGLLSFAFALIEKEGILHFKLSKWNIAGIPMPKKLAPRIEAYEHEKEGKFHFYVAASLPLVGLVVLYEGYLVPVQMDKKQVTKQQTQEKTI